MQGSSPSKSVNQIQNQVQWGAPSQFLIGHLNIKLKTNGYLAMKAEWDSGLPQHLMQIQHNWNIYKYQLKHDIIQFVKINNFKNFELKYVELDASKPKRLPKKALNLYERIYPSIGYIMQKFRQKLKLTPVLNMIQIMSNHNMRDTTTISTLDEADNYQIHNQPDAEKVHQLISCLKKEYGIKHTLIDLELLLFLQKFRHQNLKQNYHYYMELKLEQLKLEALKDHNQLVWTSQQSDLFNIAYTSHAQPNTPDMLRLRNIIAKIDRERLPNNNCLACSKFYYFNLNICDQLANKAPLKVYQSVNYLYKFQADFRDYVCAMLNGQGGIILFDCTQKYCGVIPRGQFMDLKQKEMFQRRIQSYLKYIYPKIQFGNEVVISFVPVVEYDFKDTVMENYTGHQSILKENRKYVKHLYSNGAFVTRVAVRPVNQSKTYFWQKDEKKYCYTLQSDGRKKSVSARNMLKLMRQKAKQYEFNQNLDEDSRRLLGMPTNFLNHQCEQPQMGVIANTPKTPQGQKQMQRIQELKECCLVVFRRKNYDKLKEQLGNRGIKCQIKTYFDAYKLKILLTTAVLYHNSTFRLLQEEIKNKIYDFDGKLPKIINVDGFLKIEQKGSLSEEDFMYYYRIFSKGFPQERLKMCEHRDSGELYLQTQSKLSMIFLYAQLKDKDEVVLFKYPPEWQRMRPQEREGLLITKFCNPKDR